MPLIARNAEEIPGSLPVLRRGKHRAPSHGACFMEYTSVLAGEPFSDKPACVDGDLARILRDANDGLTDAERTGLVPLLGRAIGLVTPSTAPERGWWRQVPLGRRHEGAPTSLSPSAQLRAAAATEFAADVGYPPTTAEKRRHRRGKGLPVLFWDLMEHPTTTASREEFVSRLIDRLALLHRCYGRALLGLSSPDSSPRVPREHAATAEQAPLPR